jgi:Holliday junction DNA helicase RuvB
LRDRFGFTGLMDYYTAEDLQKIVLRSAKLLETAIDNDAALEIARRSRGTARVANRILRRVRDWQYVHGENKSEQEVGKITIESTKQALELFEIDQLGLDKLDRLVLNALVERFNAGPVGVSTLASFVSEEAETIESVVEPFLVREGFITRTPRGRVATEFGINYVKGQEVLNG